MASRAESVPRPQVERVIAIVRVGLAGASLFAIWMDPAEPQRYTELTYSLHALYLAYAAVLLAFVWNRATQGWLPTTTHWTDVVLSSVFQYLTLGPSSPFFTYFTFCLFSAALRWGWRGTVRTAVTVTLAYVVMGASLSQTLGPTEFELNRFIVRIAYLGVVAVVLVHIGRHEERRREEVRRLARWPTISLDGPDVDVVQLLRHAASVVGAGRALLVWNAGEEPWHYVVSWPSAARAIERLAPGSCDPVVAEALSHTTFASHHTRGRDVFELSRAGVTTIWRGAPLHPILQSRLIGRGLASAGFETERASGRVFFTDLQGQSDELLTLTEVVGRELGASLAQSYSHHHARELAVSEERIRLARDLHDGVLQSLTGIRLELQTIASQSQTDAHAVADRLIGIERALALGQGELRRFIDDLKPQVPVGADEPLAERLDELRRRLALAWRTPITVRVQPPDIALGDRLQQVVPLMVQEAVVNALKHGQPSRVAVEVTAMGGTLAVTISDDGAGFPFSGRRDEVALAAANAGPVSLRERVTTLGGHIDVESTASGSRVELRLPLETAGD